MAKRKVNSSFSDKKIMDSYFFLFSFLVAITLFSASTVATEARILNPGNKTQLISFYTQLHMFIFTIVFLLLGGTIFSFFKKYRVANIMSILYYALSIIIVAWGVYTDIVLSACICAI